MPADPAPGRSIIDLLTVALTVAIFAMLGAALLFGLPRLQARVAAHIGSARIHVAFDWPRQAPGASGDTWMPPSIQGELIRTVLDALGPSPDPLSQAPLRAAGASLERTGWFESTPTVTRERNGLIHVRGAWRVPAAVVRHDGLDHLIATGAELLPLAYPPGTSGQRIILGVAGGPPSSAGLPAYGTPWTDGEADSVRASLSLLVLLADRPWRDQVQAIDASEYSAKRRLTIVTRFDTRIVWGGAPADAIPGEPTASTKLSRLDQLAKRFGQIDGGRRLVELYLPLTIVDDTAGPS